MQLPIKVKLMFILILVVVAPMAIIAFMSRAITYDRMEAELYARSMEALNDTKKVLLNNAKHAGALAEFLATTIEITGNHNPETIQKLLDAKEDLWFAAMVEVVNTRKKLIARSYVEKKWEPFLTGPDDPLVLSALELTKSMDFVVCDEGLAIKAATPVVRPETLNTTGAVIVTYPFNVQFLQSIKEQVQAEVTIQWNPARNIVSTFQDEYGNPLTRIWGEAVSRSEAIPGDSPLQKKERIGGKSYAVTYSTLKNQDGKTLAILSVAKSFIGIEQGKREMLKIILISSAIVLVFAILMGILIIRSITDPIAELVSVLDKYGRGDFTVRADIKSKDELGFLAGRFNAMLDQLQGSHQQLMNIIDFLPDATFVIDSEKKVIAWNRAMEEMTGVTKEEIMGKGGYAYAIPFYGEARPVTADLVLEPQAGMEDRYAYFERKGSAIFTENYVPALYRGKGAYLWSIASPLFDARGNLAGAIASHRDITERKRIEKELKRHTTSLRELIDERTAELRIVNEDLQREMAERKQLEEERLKAQKLESVGILAGGIAHDFNNMLAIILGNISLARMYAASQDRVADALDKAKMVSLQASDLTKQFIAFSRGGMPFKQIVPIEKLIGDTTKYALDGTRARYELHVEDDLWHVNADEGQLRQVIRNIIDNAREAMPDGGLITVSARNVTVGRKDALPLAEGKYVKVSIKDQGAGIPEEYLSKIFDPYFTTKELGSQKGMGLSLTVCYTIMKNHNGTIAVESGAGKGATFHVYIPSKG